MKDYRLQLLSKDGAKYLGFAENKLRQLTQERQSLNLPAKHDFFKVGDFVIYVLSANTGNVIRITGGGIVGFLFHPRSDLFPNGFTPKGEPLPNGPYIYPLIDGDHGTRLLTPKKEGWKYVKNPPEDYGNIDWKGPKGQILTWKGPPSRHFPLDTSAAYPGFTYLDEDLLSGPVYSVFGPNVYSGGNLFATVPDPGVTTSKVLGASVNNKNLVVIVGTNYRDVTNPLGVVGGFFYEVWILTSGEWSRLGLEQGVRQKEVWFFNASGTEAQAVIDQQVHKVVIAPDMGSVTFSAKSVWVEQSRSTVSATANQTELEDIGPNDLVEIANEGGFDRQESASIAHTGQRIFAVDYKGDVEVLALVDVSTSSSSNNHAIKQGYCDYSIIVPDDPGNPYPPEPLAWVPAGTAITQTVTLSTQGLCNPVISSVSCGSVVPNTLQITGLSCCPDGAITALVEDANGCRSATAVFSKTVLPSPDYPGSWEFRYPQGCGLLCEGVQKAPTTVYVMGPLFDYHVSCYLSPIGCGSGVICWGTMRITFYWSGPSQYFQFETFLYQDGPSSYCYGIVQAQILGQYEVSACA